MDRSTRRAAVVSFHDINYTVKALPQGQTRGPKEEKTILQNMSGVCKQGLNAIMGPTGGGKTSLLDILAGRKDATGLSGEVLVNGFKQPKNFKCMSGYVVQDDVVMGTLSVRENFMFSANLRLPGTVSRKEKEAKVQGVLDELGLQHCADTKIGTQFIRGVSGGERKRTNIGMELIIEPTVLFLDEPTTGLDANTANSVIRLLKVLSNRGRTIIFSIHQPRYSIYKMFDNLILLAKGLAIYQGPGMDGLEFFQQMGYECEEHNNPPDFYLDVINGETQKVSSDSQDKERRNEKHTKNGHSVGVVDVIEMGDISTRDDVRMAEDLLRGFQSSRWYPAIQQGLDEQRRRNSESDGLTNEFANDEQYKTNLLTQLKYVSHRTVLNILRSPQLSILTNVMVISLALVVGILYFDVDCTTSGLQNRIGAFFFITMNMVFSNLSSVELFIAERGIFVHENASGFYRVSAYYFSKVFCDMLPLRLIPATLFSCIAYFMIGLEVDVEKFFIFYLDLFLLSLAAASIGFFWSATVSLFAVANLLIALTFVISMIFGGLFVNLETIWVGLRWLQYFSIFRYSFYALCINELKGQEYCPTINGTEPENCNCTNPVLLGEEFLQANGVDYETAWDLWQNLLALACITLGMLVLAYIQLRRIPKFK